MGEGGRERRTIATPVAGRLPRCDATGNEGQRMRRNEQDREKERERERGKTSWTDKDANLDHASRQSARGCVSAEAKGG